MRRYNDLDDLINDLDENEGLFDEYTGLDDEDIEILGELSPDSKRKKKKK